MDKTYSSIDLAEGISDGTNSTKVRDLNCLRADLTWIWRRDQVKLRYEVQIGESFS